MPVMPQVRRIVARRPWIQWAVVAALATGVAASVADAMAGLEAERSAWGSPITVWVATVDVAAVIDHLDLRSLAEQVIAEVDLPEIIRASTGSVTSEAVRGVRMRSISGDDAVARAADRFRLRRRPAVPPPAPGTP